MPGTAREDDMWHWIIIGVVAWVALGAIFAPIIGTYLRKLNP